MDWTSQGRIGNHNGRLAVALPRSKRRTVSYRQQLPWAIGLKPCEALARELLLATVGEPSGSSRKKGPSDS
ncbi:MAG: hypothetical protein H6715_06210 [Myxococcales bacterium]|nr:hypothetical protein [Myxococcales bacterium]